jgi:hypothetical protein
MKMFKMIALMTLFLAAAAQSALADTGKNSSDQIDMSAVQCEKLDGALPKRHTASAEATPSQADHGDLGGKATQAL